MVAPNQYAFRRSGNERQSAMLFSQNLKLILGRTTAQAESLVLIVMYDTKWKPKNRIHKLELPIS